MPDTLTDQDILHAAPADHYPRTWPELREFAHKIAALATPAALSAPPRGSQEAGEAEVKAHELAEEAKTAWGQHDTHRLWRAIDALEVLAATPAASEGAAREAVGLSAEQVEWVVNDTAELGVKIGEQFFWLYKGNSLVYGASADTQRDDIAIHDNGKPMHWRPVFKREFGECCHPINHADYSRIGTVSLDDSDEWKPLPASPSGTTGGAQGVERG